MLYARTLILGATFTAVILGVLAHSAPVEAATYKLCKDTHAGAICLNAGNVKLKNLKKGKLTMQRVAGGHGNGQAGQIVVFFRTGDREYTNRNGSTIYVASPTSFTWRNNNANHIFYQKMN